MVTSVLARRLCHARIRRLLIFGMFIAIIVVFRCFTLPSWKTYNLLDADRLSIALPVEVSIAAPTGTDASGSSVTSVMPIVTYASNSKEDAYEEEADVDYESESDGDRNSRKGFLLEKEEFLNKSFDVGNHEEAIESFTQKNPKYANDHIERSRVKFLNADLSTSDTLITVKKSSNDNGTQRMEMQPENEKSQLLKTMPILNKTSKMSTRSMRSKLTRPTSITQMNSLLLQSFNSSSMRPRWSSRRDRELLSAKLGIENAPVISNSSGLYAPVFRDISKFSRSYELMERKLKIYIYREGEKPIFHQPKMRGIYASEGWFMKLMEGSKRFIVRDPRKAHLFYIPFSSQMLRVTLSEQNLHSKKMEQYLERYVQLIAGRYHFWNRTGGADHFLVACHDWASQITRQPMKNCIRSLCNANVAKGFKIGKDTSLPVTYIHSMLDPQRGLGGKAPSEKSILAFFAGSMHGYLRPILLKHWENKEPDMKIFGPMPRDVEGKRIYMEYMKSSKYCICARGYEVHTPRIIEAIFSGCVPVIISDNYVPPLFEVLNWEAFSVFVRERDIPSLRDILVSIPEEKYLALQLGVKKVQQHFQWHRIPVKYDLFHMILHSVWYNRLSQIRPR